MKKKFRCRFCKKEFSRESTLSRHICEKKRRWNQKDEKPVRLAFQAWLRFMQSFQTNKRNPYEYEDFMNSSLYISFCKYGRHLDKLNAINPSEYTDFLIKYEIKLADWTKDYPYETYMKEKIINESPNSGVERSIKILEKWANDNDSEVVDFFSKVSPNQVVHWIINGRISPWMIFCSSKSDKLFERMSREQVDFVNEFIDIKRWKTKIMRERNEVEEIRKLFEEIGV